MTEAEVVTRLAGERQRLRAELTAIANREHERCPTDLLDMAELAMRREEEARRTELIAHRLSEVDAALERVDHGSFGRCETCGARIAKERLEVLPTARSCASHADRRRRTPVVTARSDDLFATSNVA